MKISPQKIFREMHTATPEEVKHIIQIMIPEFNQEIEHFITGSGEFIQSVYHSAEHPYMVIIYKDGRFVFMPDEIKPNNEQWEEILDYLYTRRIDIYGYISKGEDIETDTLPRPKSGNFE